MWGMGFLPHTSPFYSLKVYILGGGRGEADWPEIYYYIPI
jgi:hypothetical protein